MYDKTVLHKKNEIKKKLKDEVRRKMQSFTGAKSNKSSLVETFLNQDNINDSKITEIIVEKIDQH